MDSKHSSSFNFHILNVSIARLVFFRLLFFASAISIVSLIRFLPSFDFSYLSPKTYEDCTVTHHYSQKSLSQNASLTPGSYLFQSRVINTFWGSFDSMMSNCKKDVNNLTFSVVIELMGKRFLNHGDRSLCIGEGSALAVSAMQELGFTSVSGVRKSSFFSIKHKRIVCELEFQDCSFDFVLSKDVDKVSVPALLMSEVERILKPGGIGALLVDPSSNPNELRKSATPFSSLLRSSSIVHVGNVNELTLVVFKKRSDENTRTSSFLNQHHHHLQRMCQSMNFTKPLMELIEPLVEEMPPPQEHEKRISYLPNFVDMSNRKRLVHIDIGVREKRKENVTNDWFLPSYYPIDYTDFRIYFVHYNTSILLSHVKRPGITFVYHPGLSEKVAAAKVGVDGGEEVYDFMAWFKETVKHSDFVVLKMHAGKVEMKFLKDMFESGDICFINEMFLSCSDSKEIGCMDIYKGLRDSGVFVHQWWETELHQGS